MRIIKRSLAKLHEKEKKNDIAHNRSLHTFRKPFSATFWNHISNAFEWTMDSMHTSLVRECVSVRVVHAVCWFLLLVRQIILAILWKCAISHKNQNRWCKSFDVKLGMHTEWNVHIECHLPSKCKSPFASERKKRTTRGKNKRIAERETKSELNEAKKNRRKWINYDHLPRRTRWLGSVFSWVAPAPCANVNFAWFECARIELDRHV